MAFVQDCPLCHQAVTIAEELVGVVVSCPHCGKYFNIPAPGQAGVPVEVGEPTAIAAAASIQFSFICQRCDSVLEGRPDLCGQHGTCPTCGAIFIVPGLDPQTGRAAGPAIVADDGQLPTPLHAYATAGDKAPHIRRLEDNSQLVVCPRCRTEMPVDADVCSACGIPFTLEGVSAISKTRLETNSIATLAMTVGIAAVLTSPCQPIVGIVAIAMGINGYQKARRMHQKVSGKYLCLAAIICGIVAVIIWGVSFWALGHK